LVGRGVTTQAPSNNSNNNNNTSNNTNIRNLRIQSQKKSTTFNIKQERRVFLISLKKRKKHVMYVNGGRVMAAVSI
jgi:hypothetical protein